MEKELQTLKEEIKKQAVETATHSEEWEQELARQQDAEREEWNFSYAEDHKDDPKTDYDYLIECMWLPF